MLNSSIDNSINKEDNNAVRIVQDSASCGSKEHGKQSFNRFSRPLLKNESTLCKNRDFEQNYFVFESGKTFKTWKPKRGTCDEERTNRDTTTCIIQNPTSPVHSAHSSTSDYSNVKSLLHVSSIRSEDSITSNHPITTGFISPYNLMLKLSDKDIEELSYYPYNNQSSSSTLPSQTTTHKVLPHSNSSTVPSTQPEDQHDLKNLIENISSEERVELIELLFNSLHKN
ncbi:hypothetical protein ABK040_010164 [Willaertia magna]